MSKFTELLKSYKKWFFWVLLLGVISNLLALIIPRISGNIIDAALNQVDAGLLIWQMVIVALITLIVTIVQIYLSTLFSEKVAFDIRTRLIQKIGNQSFDYISTSTPGRLLTVATSDIDAVKDVVSQGLVTLLGALVTLVGSIILLISINTKLGLLTVSVIPLLVIVFAIIFGKLASLFRRNQENVEVINSFINETIVGAALIRVLNSVKEEMSKFEVINTQAKEVGLGIVKSISALIPAITLLSNLSIMIIIWFGGKSVIDGVFSLGQFSAFISYSAMFVWPLFILSFVGTSISRGFISLNRINEVLDAPIIHTVGTRKDVIKGEIEFKDVSLSYVDASGVSKEVLKKISFKIKAGTKNAIVGPTAGGKTQIFYLMSGLVTPTTGEILIDGIPVSEFDKDTLFRQIGLVFQDSIMFNTTLRENIVLSGVTSDELLKKAVKVSELDGLVASLPQGMDTLVSERGTSLSGGQKQRVMLARALAIDPQVLLLDDFTARVDQATEKTILKQVFESYSHTTLVSITQKIESIKDYDHIIVIMEGELVADGTHQELLSSSFEYKQIYESQNTTN